MVGWHAGGIVAEAHCCEGALVIYMSPLLLTHNEFSAVS